MAEHATSTPAPAAEQSGFTLDITALSDMPGQQLLTIYEALMAASEAALGILNQPRCKAPDGFTPGGEVIEQLVEELSQAALDVVGIAKARQTTDVRDAEMCAWIEVKYQAMHMDGLADLAALVSRHAASHEHRRSMAGARR